MARDEDQPRMPQAQHRGGKDQPAPKREVRKHPYTGVNKGKVKKDETIRIGNPPKKKDKRAQDLKADQASRKGPKHASKGCAITTIGLLGGAALLTEELIRWVVL